MLTNEARERPLKMMALISRNSNTNLLLVSKEKMTKYFPHLGEIESIHWIYSTRSTTHCCMGRRDASFVEDYRVVIRGASGSPTTRHRPDYFISATFQKLCAQFRHCNKPCFPFLLKEEMNDYSSGKDAKLNRWLHRATDADQFTFITGMEAQEFVMSLSTAEEITCFYFGGRCNAVEGEVCCWRWLSGSSNRDAVFLVFPRCQWSTTSLPQLFFWEL